MPIERPTCRLVFFYARIYVLNRMRWLSMPDILYENDGVLGVWMRLFITGATGYIGFHVATAFRRAGCEVFGLTHSERQVHRLERNEIIPVFGSLQRPDSFADIARESDVIVHAAIDSHADAAALDRATVEVLLEGASSAAQSATVIYTSSIWVLGNRGGQPLTEQSLFSPPKTAAWRPDVEQHVLNAKNVKGLVIRPGVVYGKGGGLTGMWFQGASNDGVVRIVGDGENHWAMVHVDDLADGYLRAAQSGLSGAVFNLADASRSTIMKMSGAAACAAGNIRQLEFVPVDRAIQEMGHLAEALALDQIVDASKARRVLDWQPRHKGFIPK